VILKSKIKKKIYYVITNFKYKKISTLDYGPLQKYYAGKINFIFSNLRIEWYFHMPRQLTRIVCTINIWFNFQNSICRISNAQYFGNDFCNAYKFFFQRFGLTNNLLHSTRLAVKNYLWVVMKQQNKVRSRFATWIRFPPHS